MAETLRQIASNVAKTRACLAEAKKDLQHIQTLQNALKETLEPLWSAPAVEELIKLPHLWKELLSLIASARIITVSAQAEAALSVSKDIQDQGIWLADGRAYSRWVGTGVVSLAKARDASDHDMQKWKAVSDLFAKSFGIGYADDVVDVVVSRLVLEGDSQVERLQCLVRYVPRPGQRAFLSSLLHLLAKRFFLQTFVSRTQDKPRASDEERKSAACAAMLQHIVQVNKSLVSEHLISWLSDGPNAPIGLCRAVIAALSNEDREVLLEKVWQTFSDKLYIKHTLVTQQEALMRIILLCAGAVHKVTPMQVYMLAHSSFQTSGISARLGTTSQRARFLGMALGTAVSQLVDKPETRMKFDFDSDEEKEFRFFQSLLRFDFDIGSIKDLAMESSVKADTTSLLKTQGTPSISKTDPKPVVKAQAPKIMVVEEDDNEEDDDDDGLTPMAKPDSDAEDSDPDPTVTRRDKPKAPVYIRDLLTQLSSTEDAPTHTLALHTAPSLIRRKATFGSELLDQSPALATTLASLPDPFHLEGFHTLQAQAMIALLVALPKEMGPWFANAIWTGEYNVAQRVGMLSAIGLSGRELAGYGREGDSPGEEESFASKRLPERLHRIYSQESEIATLARKLEISTALTPVTGTTIKRRQRPRTKLVKNDLSKIVGDSFFLPLMTGYRDARGVAGAATKNVLPPLLQTLSILLTLSAKSTPSLPTLTTEYWSLLLSLRTRAIADPPLLEALLFGLLSVFEAWKDNARALAEGWGRQVVETCRWGEVVFDKLEEGAGVKLEISGGDLGMGGGSGRDEQGQRCRMLAAGMLMAAKEVVEAHHRLLVGEMVDWK